MNFTMSLIGGTYISAMKANSIGWVVMADSMFDEGRARNSVPSAQSRLCRAVEDL